MTSDPHPDPVEDGSAAASVDDGSSAARIDDGLATARRLVRRADEVAKAAPGASDPAAVRDRARHLLDDARQHVDDARQHVDDARDLALATPVDERRDIADLAVQIARRMLDLDGADLAATAVPSPDMRRAPTTVDDPARRPPGQHLTGGFPVLHVGSAPSVPVSPSEWTVTVTGRVHDRVRVSVADLRPDGVPTTSDFHCVTGWSRLDNAWTGIPVAELVARARPRAEASHAIVAGHPAYSANFHLDDLARPDVLLAWAVDGSDLDVAHGGPLRLVVPHLYGWKSVKWVTEIRLVERDVPGYWEERGYHLRGDPWQEQRFRDD